MAIVTKSFAVDGLDGFSVEIEATTLRGMPNVSITGLGDQAIKEAADRLAASMTHCGYSIPQARVIISLAPCDKRKRGSHYDLAMVVALLTESKQIKPLNLSKYAFIGELSLNGNIRPCNGIIPMIIEAKSCGITDVILPMENANEARMIDGINIHGMPSLDEVIKLLEAPEGSYIEPIIEYEDSAPYTPTTLDFSEVKGQDELIEAILLGVAGRHNILMIGEPGCGKTMIAERIPTIMPTMLESEALEVTKIQSVAGILPPIHSLVKIRPFRSPHHNASLNSIIGGGNPAMPGEVSLAHNGVLFLDELPEFTRSSLESLRQPMENRFVTIARVNGSNTYPANFMLVAAMNPCPCGYYPSNKCRCSDYEIKKYRSKISGPILERIDIQKQVKPINYFNLANQESRYTSAYLRNLVERALEIQTKRYKDFPEINTNSQMTSSLIKEYCKLNLESEDYLKKACDLNSYSARVINKLLRLARTSADLKGNDNISIDDIHFILSCRDLDVSTSNMYTV